MKKCLRSVRPLSSRASHSVFACGNNFNHSSSRRYSSSTENGSSNGEVKLVGTVEPYETHYLISTTVPPEQWPKDVTVKNAANESEGNNSTISESNPQNHQSDFILQFKDVMDKNNISTTTNRISSYYDSTAQNGTDIIVFPHQIKYSNLKPEDITTVLNNNSDSKSQSNPDASHSNLKKKSYDPITVLICSHMNRDKGCGVKGPEIYQAAKDWIEQNKVDQSHVSLLKTSHLGGHKFSGICVVYPYGDWYGKVDKHSIASILEVYLKNKRSSSGEPNIGISKEVLKMWRGRMNLSKQEQTDLLKRYETPLYVADLSVV